MVFSLKTVLLRIGRNKHVDAVERQALAIERVDARELKRMQDELKLVREKARLQDVMYRNGIF